MGFSMLYLPLSMLALRYFFLIILLSVSLLWVFSVFFSKITILQFDVLLNKSVQI